MLIKQISIFVENKPGRLSNITNILKQNDIDIRALSIADTKDFGILRLIVNDPDKACNVLKGAECTVTITDVLAVGISDEPGGLSVVMNTLYNNAISVEYMYAFAQGDTAHVVIRPSNVERCMEILNKFNCNVLTKNSL